MDTNRRFRWIWAVMLILIVGVATFSAYSGDHRLSSTWLGIITGLLLLLYLSWIFVGWFHRLPLRARGLGIRLAAWFAALAVSVVLVSINHDFMILLWILFGSTPFYLGVRVSVVPMIGVLVLIGLFQAGGPKLPHGRADWESLTGWLLGSAIWVLLILAVERLVRQRNENEQLIAELRASQEQLRQAAAKERELLVHRERARLARDLHDIIGHALVLASVKLEAVQRLNRVDRERAAAELTATQQLLRQTMTELRQAVTNLRTAPESETELIPLADQLQTMVDETEIPATVAVERVDGLSPLQTDALRRIAQEALTNVVKHADATEISVAFHRGANEAVLEIADNGRGFSPPDGPAAGHYGVRGMHERIELVGGCLTVRSVPGAGTQVRATIPLRPVEKTVAIEVPEVTRGAA